MTAKRARYLDGKPTNLEAAANDARDWLRFTEDLINKSMSQKEIDLFVPILKEAIKSLEEFLPQSPPVFKKSLPKEPVAILAL